MVNGVGHSERKHGQAECTCSGVHSLTGEHQYPTREATNARHQRSEPQDTKRTAKHGGGRTTACKGCDQHEGPSQHAKGVGAVDSAGGLHGKDRPCHRGRCTEP